MELILFIHNILTAYLFGYAVFFIVSLIFKNQKFKNFVDFSETKIPVIGLLLFFIFIVVFSVEFCERSSFLGGLKQFSFPGDKLIKDFFLYQLLNVVFLILPSQFFRSNKVKESVIIKSILIIFFIFNLNWILEKVEIYLNLTSQKSYFSFFYFSISKVKMILVFLVLNFILYKFFKKKC